MGQTIAIDIINGFYQSDSVPFNNQRCVNLYPVIPDVPGLTPGALFNVQGLTEVASSSNQQRDANRGGIVFNNVPYFLNGFRLLRLDQTVTQSGKINYNLEPVAIIPGTGFCSFSSNGKQVLIIDSDGTGYIFSPTNSPNLQVISDPGFYANGRPQQSVFVDGYFIVTTDEKKAIVSAINDGLDWNSIDFISAESDPDEVVSSFVFRNQLYLLGNKTTEAFNNIGGAGVPFRRSGFFLSTGCSAKFSVIELGNQVMWIGGGENEKPAIYAFNGAAAAQKISTIAIDNKLHELSVAAINNAFAWSYTIRGAAFVAFNVDDFTFVYDLSTGRWHERQSIVTNTQGVKITKRCRINTVLLAYNEQFVGDSEDGRIGLVSADAYEEYQDPLQSFFTSSPIYNNNLPFSLSSVELLCESGVGNDNVQDPVVLMSISRDGAVFENPRTRNLGRVGDRKLRQVWYKNGQFRQFGVLRVSVSDAVKRRFYGLSVKLRPGTKR